MIDLSKKNRNPPQPASYKIENITIKSNERVFIAGKTGSGKTTLALYLLFSARRLLLIDSKDGLFDWNTVDYSKANLDKFDKGDDIRLRVVNDEDAFKALDASYSSLNNVVYIDEVTAIAKNNTKPEQIFLDIWMRGRSRNIGAFATSQRPKNVPLVFLSEAEHLFCFQLNLEDDRSRMSEVMGDSVKQPVKDRFGFYYYSVNSGKLKYFKRLTL